MSDQKLFPCNVFWESASKGLNDTSQLTWFTHSPLGQISVQETFHV